MNNRVRYLSAILIPTATFAQNAPTALMAPSQPQPAPMSTTAPVTSFEAIKVATAPAGSGTLPANTDVLLRLDEEVSSKRVKTGHKFRLSVVQDVMIGSYIVIPRGTPATGEVGYRSGKGAFGKSAKM